MNPAYNPCPFPVGYIVHMTDRATNPTDLWPGTTWEEISGRFLLGAGSAYPVGTTGGEATHTLTLAEMPMHSSHVNIYSGNAGSKHGGFVDYIATAGGSQYGTEYVGENAPHNNMPPYKAVYIWERTG